MSKTLRPTKAEQAAVRDFEHDLRTRGEMEARQRYYKKVAMAGAVSGAADMAIWAAVLAGLGAVALWWKKKEEPPNFGSDDPIINEARRLGLG